MEFKNWYILRGLLCGDKKVGHYVYKQFPIDLPIKNDVVVYTDHKDNKITFQMNQKTKDTYFKNRIP